MVSKRERLLAYHDLFPLERHPLWTAVIRGELTLDGVLRAETQHYLRTRAGQGLRKRALESAEAISPDIWQPLLETYLEECTSADETPSHLDLVERLLVIGGIAPADLARAQPTVANAAAIALYRDIGERGAGCHMVAAGAVEYFYCQLAPTVFQAYTTHYSMTAEQAETYRIHGTMDREHADRAFSILDEAVRVHGWEAVDLSTRDAFVATSLHYDGMLEAARGVITFWDGK